jgi:hypothetical protein
MSPHRPYRHPCVPCEPHLLLGRSGHAYSYDMQPTVDVTIGEAGENILCLHSFVVGAPGESAFWADIDSRDVTASVHVLDYEGFSSLAGYFRGLADHWGGWDGERTWTSYEHNLKLAARYSGFGPVRLVATFWTFR